jgi:hypothetical protein
VPDPEKAALMRSVNEGIALFATGLEPGDPDVVDRWSFVCECGVRDCVEWVELDLAAYEAIRSRPDAVVLANGHGTAALRGAA